jgi:WD40 repeat protein
MLAFSPDGKRFLAASRESSAVHLVDLEAVPGSKDLELPEHVGALAWHPGGRHFAAACRGIGAHASRDLNIYFASLDGAEAPRVLRGHGSVVVAMAFNHGGDLLASVGWDGTLRLWHPYSGEELVRSASPLTSARGLQFSGDDSVLGYCRSNSVLSLYRPIASEEHFLLRGDTGAMYSALSLSPDGRLLASAVGPRGVKLWCTATRREVAHLRVGSVNWLVFQPGTGHLVTSNVEGLGVHVWPVNEDHEAPGRLRVGPPGRIARDIAFPRYLAVSADGGYLAVLKGDSDAAILDLTRPENPLRVVTHPGVMNVAISRSGRWLATASGTASEVRIWDGLSGKQVAELPALPLAFIAFDPKGRRLAVGTTQECCLWEAESWRRIASFRVLTAGATSGWIAFSSDGRLLAMPEVSGIVRLLDPAAGKDLAHLDLSATQLTGGLRFGRSDTLLAGSRLNRIDLWDLRRIRARLREMGLDWTEEPLPPEPEPAPVLEVEIDLGELGKQSR